MSLRELLTNELRDLLHAETQLTGALPKMAQAARNPRLKQAFEKHLNQTQDHVERLKQAFELIGAQADPNPCRAMMGLIEEGKETIEEGGSKDEISADLCLITAAQKVEHYEIAGYGTARAMARQLRLRDVEQLLSRTLGEEESTDFLLTEIAKPLVQQATLNDAGEEVDLESTPASGDRELAMTGSRATRGRSRK